ncbi:MAG: CinA family nicotinamide mononucleotide deamidase-related protein [Prevotellaceae bacterium]|nr:CinA family nicotinamide mononucleotide deamidase-related protein [Prevotellaceae bacterium]
MIIITVGNEILSGLIVDTNSAYIAAQCDAAGLKVRKIISVSDDADEIADALASSFSSPSPHCANVTLITGGLGPTNDDVTKIALARFFNCTETVVHRPSLENIEARFAARGIASNELNRQQAEVPACCTAILNRHGTAPGMWFERDAAIAVAMPGVPSEMKAMLPDVLNRLAGRFVLPNIVRRTMMVYGIPESTLAEMIAPWERMLPENMSLAYLPDVETGVKLRLSTTTDNKDSTAIDERFAALAPLLGDSVYGYAPDSLESVVGQRLAERNATLAVAESCTGGSVARRITSVPGCSAWFKGGIVAYSDEAKANLLGIDPRDLERFGAVSAEIAERMAIGVRRALNSDFAAATTGFAGPAGGTDENPVGTCFVAVAAAAAVNVVKYRFVADRATAVAAAAATALNRLRLFIN